jgi:hypothetical protein
MAGGLEARQLAPPETLEWAARLVDGGSAHTGGNAMLLLDSEISGDFHGPQIDATVFVL